jgi:hypothetical protein
MRLNKISEMIIFRPGSDPFETKRVIFPRLNNQFDRIGLKGTVKGNYIDFKKNPEKPDDFGRMWKLRDFFSLIRQAHAEFIDTSDKRLTLEVSIDLKYLYIFSVGSGICFCLGFAFFISDIGLQTYLATAFSIMTFSLTAGGIYIWTVLAEIVKQVKKTKSMH